MQFPGMPDECPKGLPRVLLEERLLDVCSELVDLLRDHGRDQRVLRGEAAEDGGMADAGPAGDLVDADVAAALGEERGRGIEDAFEVALRVCAELGAHAAGTGATAASASILATWRRRSSTNIVTSPARTKAAPPAKAQWKPVTRASGSVAPPGLVGLLAASVERIARPSAPPICCDVLKRPDASPWSSSSSPVVAMSVSGMNTAPMPSDVTISAGRTSATYVPSTGSRTSRSIPIAETSIPSAATGRTPNRGANCEARPAESITPAVNGRIARPASNGP